MEFEDKVGIVLVWFYFTCSLTGYFYITEKQPKFVQLGPKKCFKETITYVFS